MLVGDDPFPYYEGIDWTTQSQHVFRDNLRLAARRLIEPDAAGALRVIDYGQFTERYGDPATDEALAPLARLFAHCQSNLKESPLWWARLVGYAYATRWLITNQGSSYGFSDRPLDVQAALAATDNEQINVHLAEYPALFDRVLEEAF